MFEKSQIVKFARLSSPDQKTFGLNYYNSFTVFEVLCAVETFCSLGVHFFIES